MKKLQKRTAKIISLFLALMLTITGCGAKGPAVTDTVQWFNNTYAVLTMLNQRDYRVYSGGPANTQNKIIAQALLQRDWDVTDRETADERRGIYENLKSSSDNPFTLDWNTALEKTW